MNSYATSGDLATWLDTAAPANADQLLRSATALVAVATGRNPYTDVPGDDAEPLRDATTAQAAAWVALNLDPAAQGIVTDTASRSRIGTAEVWFDTADLAAAREKAATELAPEARAILLAAGLLLLDLPVFASTDDDLYDYGLAGTRPRIVPNPLTT